MKDDATMTKYCVGWSLTSIFSTNMAISETKLWPRDNLSVLCVCVFFGGGAASIQHLSEVMQFLGFPVSPGSAETLARRGGKIKYLLIARFCSNISAMNVEIIVSQLWWYVFWATVACLYSCRASSPSTMPPRAAAISLATPSFLLSTKASRSSIKRGYQSVPMSRSCRWMESDAAAD